VINNTCCSNSLYGIYFLYSTSSTMASNICNNNTNGGIYLCESDYNIVTGNTCNYNGWSGIILGGFDSGGSDYCTVVHNICNNNFQSGTQLASSSFCNLTANTCNNNQNGIFLDWSASNNVTSNTCNNNTNGGIWLMTPSSFNTVANNTCNNNQWGIRLNGANSDTVTNNTCSNNSNCGIYLYHSNFHNVTYNTCSNNNRYGIMLSTSCSSNLVANNTCSDNNYYGDGYGIYLYDGSNSNVVANNTVADSYMGIHIFGSSYNIITHNIVRGNGYGIILNQYSLYNNVVNNTCNDNPGRGISVDWWSEFNNVTNNICINNGYFGIVLWRANYTIVANNTCSSSSYDGIHVRWSSFNTIANNRFVDFLYGIHIFENSNNNTVTNNTCIENTAYGIFIEEIIVLGIVRPSNNNYIIWNLFLDNSINAVNDIESSVFDYNYWSDYSGPDENADYIGDIPYPIPGLAGSIDPHPMILWWIPPSWDEPIMDLYLESGQEFRLDLNASAPTPITWWLNDTIHFAMGQQGVITNLVDLSVGMYGLEVRVTNAYGIYRTGAFALFVVDTIVPEWVEEPVDQILEYGDTLHYALSATDVSPLSHWWIDDTVNFSISEYGFVSSNTTLPVGLYSLSIFVNDTFGNTLTITITITIQDTTAPVWESELYDVILEQGSQVDYHLGAWDLSGISRWVIDDTVQFAVTSVGWVFNIVDLAPGQHGIAVTVIDNHRNSHSTSCTITIVSTDLPTWTEAPTDQAFEFGNKIDYDLDANDFSGIDSWSLDDRTYFAINMEGTITNRTNVPVGDYQLTIMVSDTLGNSENATITITVEDTTAPTWAEIPLGSTLYEGESLSIQLHAWDLSGIAQWQVDDYDLFTISSNGRIGNVVSLGHGTYTVNVTVSDPYGNARSTGITILVLASTTHMISPMLLGISIAGGVMGITVILYVAYRFRLRRGSGSGTTKSLRRKSGTNWKEALYV